MTASREPLTTIIADYGFRACVGKSAVADLDNDIADLGETELGGASRNDGVRAYMGNYFWL
jgi:hypothetical protein